MTSIAFIPTKDDLDQIEAWLKEEFTNSKNNEGFYNNWKRIKDAFVKNQLIVLRIDNMVIGFFEWSDHEFYADIEIFAIHEKFRKKGFGTYLLNGPIDYFKKKNIKLFKLFCEPKESESFWKKLGFIKYPISLEENPLTYYKSLTAPINTTPVDENNCLKLINPSEPKEIWSWNINDISSEKPLIFPCSEYWKLSIIIDGCVQQEDYVKNFPYKPYESFIKIESI